MKLSFLIDLFWNFINLFANINNLFCKSIDFSMIQPKNPLYWAIWLVFDISWIFYYYIVMTTQISIKLFLLSETNVINLLSLIFQNIHNFIILFRLYSDSPKEWTNTSLFSFLYCSFCSASRDLVSYQSKTFHPIVLVEGVYDDMAIDETQRISTSHTSNPTSIHK